jgi:rhomboid protease GluP
MGPGPIHPVAPSSPKRPSVIDRVRRFPGTYGLIGITVTVFLLQWLSKLTYGQDLVLILGAKVNQAIAAGELWRLLTPVFVHAGLWHLFVNMYSLFALGPAVERFFGSPRTLAFYLLSGVSGVTLSLAFSPYPSVGASGAIFGLLGALATFLFHHRAIFGRTGWMQFRQIVVVALLNLGLGLMPGIDNWGHLGGLLAGISLTWFLGPHLEPFWITPAQAQLHDHRPWQTVWPGSMVAVAVIAMLALAVALSPAGP